MRELSARYGPPPFPVDQPRPAAGVGGGGIEYPGAIQMLDGCSRLVAVHETAHQWFYGMVGDSQALHAWLDEAFASYAEQLVDNDGGTARQGGTLNLPGSVDKPTADYGDARERAYYTITYDKGSAALFAARDAAGADA